jgi:hypothetical protein
MGKIKSFKLFLESYSDDLSDVLSNEENNYIVMKGDDVISGFEYLEDAFENISELLDGDGTLDEEQKYEFNDLVSQLLSTDDELVEQDEIDQILNEILDKFGIIEPYKIMNRMELEETPIDNSFDEYEDDEEGVPMRSEDPVGLWDIDEEDNDGLEEELEDFVGESREPFCIVGNHNGKTEEIDSFMSSEEAESYIEDYKKIYSEYEDMKVIHRDEMNESNLIFVTENEDDEDKECEECESDNDNEKIKVKTFKDFLN